MVQAGVPVAMATDFNPGSCPCLNMQLVISLGCLRYRLTPEQALTAVTLNGAAAICRADRIGSIEPGKQADILIWNAEDLDYICYRLGSNLVDTVIKKRKRRLDKEQAMPIRTLPVLQGVQFYTKSSKTERTRQDTVIFFGNLRQIRKHVPV